MPHGGHVFGAVALAQAGEVLLEGDAERPAEGVLDRPMAAHGRSEGFGRERARGDGRAPRHRDLALVFHFGIDHGGGGGLGEAEGAGIRAPGFEPVDVLRDPAGSDLEPAMTFIDLLAEAGFAIGRR